MAVMTEAMGVRILLVDDDALVRSGLRLMLDDPPTLTVVGEANDGSRVQAAVDTWRPDVVLMDIRMPGLDGLSATNLLRRRPDPPEVILLTAFHVDEYVLRALRAGAAGFLLKDSPPTEIVRAIIRVAAGEPFLSPAVLRQVIKHVGGTGGPGRKLHAQALLGRLSERERMVAVALGQGRSNAEIGADLFVSVATVKAHVSSILTKLDLNNRTQIALLAHDAALDEP